MTRYFFQGGCVVVDGPQYILEKSLITYEHIIDRLCVAFGVKESDVTTDRSGYDRRHSWQGVGRLYAKKAWRRMAAKHDVVDEALVHTIGPLTVKAYLLGKTWLVYHKGEDRVSTPTNGGIGELDPAPTLCLYGEECGEGEYASLSIADMEVIQRVIDEDLFSFGITAQIVTATRQNDEIVGYFVWLSFSHAMHGNGYGPLSVRCVQYDGSEIPRSLQAPIN